MIIMCLNLHFEAKNQLTFTKWDRLNIVFAIQYIWCFKNFWDSANILLQIPIKKGKNKEDVQSRIFFEAQKYEFFLKRGLIFFQMVILARLFRRNPTLWKSTLKITTLFWRCLTLFSSTLKYTTLFRRCLALQISTLTYTSLFERWFDVVWRCDVVST